MGGCKLGFSVVLKKHVVPYKKVLILVGCAECFKNVARIHLT